jgi:hypothetical protein
MSAPGEQQAVERKVIRCDPTDSEMIPKAS